jgi:glucose-1-phosphate adenylyltransferase
MATRPEVLSVILGGGAGTRLYPLTRRRSKPAVPIGGKYRLVDIPISNCIHSGFSRICLLTQFNSVSLHRHIARTYKFDDFSGGFVQILAAEQTPRHTDWFQGTADAVRKHMHELRSIGASHTLILSGDHLYRMDYRPFLDAHLASGADVTLAVKPVSRKEATRFGVVSLGDRNRITCFHEKPQDPGLIEELAVFPDPERPCLASMGVYLFRSEALYGLLHANPGPDFGAHILPLSLATCHVQTYPFDGYWQDIGTTRSFFEANLALTDPGAEFSFFDPEWPIYTEPGCFPCSEISDGCDLQRVILSDGCRLHQGVSAHRSVIGTGSVIGAGSVLREVVMMGSDALRPYRHLSAEERQDGDLPPVGVGRGCRIEQAILDKGARIGDGVVIRALPERPPSDTPSYAIRDGIVVVMKNGVIPAGTVI